MWNRRAPERRFSPSDWNEARTEDMSNYDSSKTNEHNDSETTLQSSSFTAEMNIDSIYDAIKANDDIEGNNSSGAENLIMDSMRVHHDHPRKTSLVSAGPGIAVKRFTQRQTCEGSFTDSPTLSSPDSMDAPPTTNIWSRLLRGNDELWDKGDVFNDDDDDSDTLQEEKCVPLNTCTRSWYYETRHFFATLGKYPYIVIASFLVFALVLGAGMTAIQSEKERHIQKMKGTAYFVVSVARLYSK